MVVNRWNFSHRLLLLQSVLSVAEWLDDSFDSDYGSPVTMNNFTFNILKDIAKCQTQSVIH